MLNSTSVSEWIGYIQFAIDDSQNNQNQSNYNWLYAAICSALVGLTGLVPIFLLPNQENRRRNDQEITNNNSGKNKDNQEIRRSDQEEVSQVENSDLPQGLRWMLSFAVGGLLGDTFLHLLPEALASAQNHQDFNTGNPNDQ